MRPVRLKSVARSTVIALWVFSVFWPGISSGAQPAAEEADPEALLQEAWYCEEGLRDLEGAIRIYERIIRMAPNDAGAVVQAFKRQGDCYERLGERAKAWEVYRRLYSNADYVEEIENLPVEYRAEMRDAQVFDEAFGGGNPKQMEEARKALERMSPGEVFHRWGQFRREGLRLRNVNPERAIQSLKMAIAFGVKAGQTADCANLQTTIGQIYLELGKPDEARRAFRLVHDRFADEPEYAAWALVSVAEVYRRYGRLSEAIDAYAEVPAAYPDQRKARAWALLWMGDCYREKDDLTAAYRKWEDVLDFPEDDDMRWPVRAARWLLGIEPVPHSIDIKGPWANDVMYFVGIKHELMGRYVKAAEAFRASLGKSNDDWPAHVAMLRVSFYDSFD